MSKSGVLTHFNAIHLCTKTDDDGTQRKEYLVVVKGEITDKQKYFAEICKGAKYVAYQHRYSSGSLNSGKYGVYEVTATYPSIEEGIYGDQSDDYND
jgi:hypothetical protein